MSSIVKYNSKYISPISSITINHSMAQNRDGECTNPTSNITLNGYLLTNRGSPTSSGTFGLYGPDDCETIAPEVWLNSLLTKHCALSDLFADNYKELEIGTETGSSSLKAYPRVNEVDINNTENPQYFQYTITLEADNIYCGGTALWPTGCSLIRSYDESWDITYEEGEPTAEYGDNRLFKINHSVSAVGSAIAGTGGLTTPPLTNAKNFVCARLKDVSAIPVNCVDNFNYSGELYNYFDSHTMDPVNGSYSVTESWYCTDNPYIENYTIETQGSADQSCPTVSIQGAVRGFERRVNGAVPASGSKYYNAKVRFDAFGETGIFDRAETLSNLDLDPISQSTTISRNIFNGEITYSYNYKKMPTRLLPSAKFEKIALSNNWNEDIYASITILGKGDLIQPVAPAGRARKTSLSIDAVYPCGTGIGVYGPRYYSPYASELQTVINSYNPTGLPDCQYAVVDSQSEDWDRIDGSYKYSITWAWMPTGICT